MKAWTITWKDTLIRFRDRSALLLYLVAPIVLSFIMGAAFSGLGDGGESPVTDIPVIVVNEDEGEMGAQVTEALTGIDDLLAVTMMTDVETAVAEVEAGNVVAVIHIPADFSAISEPTGFGGFASDETALNLYTDPTGSISPLIVSNIVNQLVSGFNSGVVGSKLLVAELFKDLETLTALGSGGDIEAAISAELGGFQDEAGEGQITLNSIALTSAMDEDTAEPFNPITFFAPSMAIFFVMFSVIDGARSLLEEELAGTLDRLVSTPTSSGEILLGKIGGTFLTGVLQLSILIVFSLLFFGLRWGDSALGLVLMIIMTVAAATSLGTLLAGFATNPNQIGIMGTAVVLIFAVLGGNFIPPTSYPDWMLTMSRFTLNYWAIEGFSDLTIRGLGFSDILLECGVLLGITVIFFALGVWRFQQRMAR